MTRDPRPARLCGHALAHLGCVHAVPLPPGDRGPRYCAAPNPIRSTCRFCPEKDKR